MEVTGRERKLAERILAAYARDAEGLTLEECRKFEIPEAQAQALTAAMPRGAAGEIDALDRGRLLASGLPAGVIAQLAGEDGRRALAARARWLGGRLVFDIPWVKRFDAAEELRGLGDLALPAARRLAGRLASPYVAMRLAACQDLEILGAVARSALPALVPIIRDPDAEVRFAAVFAIAGVGGQEPLGRKALCSALANPDPHVRVAAAIVVGRLGIAEPAALESLGRMLGGSDEPAARAAAEAIERLGPVAGVLLPQLRRAAEGRRPMLRCDAVTAIGALKGAGGDAVPLLTARLSDGNAEVRAAAAEALERQGGKARPAVSGLVIALSDPDLAVVDAAQDALLRIVGREEMIALLTTAMPDSPRPRRLQLIVEDLSSAFAASREKVASSPPSTEKRLEALKAMLANEDPFVRVHAARSLAGMGMQAQPALPQLRGLLHDPEGRVQREVEYAIAAVH